MNLTDLTDEQIEGIVDAVIEGLEYDVEPYGWREYSIQGYLPKEGLMKVKGHINEVLMEMEEKKDEH